MKHDCKTSDTHPLQIYEIPVGNNGGLIGLSMCPGKSVVDQSGNWRRDMVKDIAAIKSWKAYDVLSLIEFQELMELGVMALPEALDAMGIEWHHLPITDMQAPCKGFDNMWKHVGKKIKITLLDGGRLVIHSRGELGRAATIAAKILIETGHAPQAAIGEIHAICGSQALQTPEQINYLRQLSA